MLHQTYAHLNPRRAARGPGPFCLSDKTKRRLEDKALGLLALLLLELLDVDVLPDEDGGDAKRDERCTSNNHQALRMGVSANDGLALGRAVGERHLQDQIAEDGGGLVLGALGEPLVQLAGRDAVPHSARDGVANG